MDLKITLAVHLTCVTKIRNVPCPAVPSLIPRCLVYLMDLYMSKLPQYAFQKDVFFLRPKKKTPGDTGEAWYENVAVGKNTL